MCLEKQIHILKVILLSPFSSLLVFVLFSFTATLWNRNEEVGSFIHRELNHAEGSVLITSVRFYHERDRKTLDFQFYTFPKRIFIFSLIHSAVHHLRLFLCLQFWHLWFSVWDDERVVKRAWKEKAGREGIISWLQSEEITQTEKNIRSGSDPRKLNWISGTILHSPFLHDCCYRGN